MRYGGEALRGMVSRGGYAQVVHKNRKEPDMAKEKRKERKGQKESKVKSKFINKPL